MQQRGTIRTIIAAAIVAVAAASCNNGKGTDSLLTSADSLLSVGAADSAMSLLDSMEAQLPSFSRAAHMRFRLLQADAMNKTYRDFTTDSVMREVADYYDHHGTPNERLRAYYLLGCTYRDMHEAPLAIITWEDAITMADTLSPDCDYNMICNVWSQLSEAYHATLLFSQEIACLHKSYHSSLLDGDTLYAIDDIRRIGSCFTLLHQYDSAEFYFCRAQELYHTFGYTQKGLLASTSLIYLYLEQNRLKEAKKLMDLYETEFEEFDENHELPLRRRQYYCYKGLYLEKVGQLDSAELYYRKAVRPKMRYISQDPVYAGLLRVFQQRGQADSIARYAHLYCAANDSSIAITDRELAAQAAANYNYTRSQNEAVLQKEQSSRLLVALIALGAILIASTTITIAIIKHNRERKRRQNLEIAHLRHNLKFTKSEYATQIQALKQLESMHKTSMDLLRQDVNRLNIEKEEDKSQLEEAQRMSASYEESINRLSTDIERKKHRIETLEHLLGKYQMEKNAQDFEDMQVVKHIKELMKNYDKMTKHDCHELIEAGRIHYPLLLEDLQNSNNITRRAIQVCLLLLVCDRVEDIANLLDVTGSRITNLKGDISQALFGKKDSRSLTQKLSEHYGTPIP